MTTIPCLIICANRAACGVASSEKSIEVCRVTKEEAALLNIQKGDLQLCVKSTAFDANEQVLYTGVQIINGDLFSLYVYESEQ